MFDSYSKSSLFMVKSTSFSGKHEENNAPVRHAPPMSANVRLLEVSFARLEPLANGVFSVFFFDMLEPTTVKAIEISYNWL